MSEIEMEFSGPGNIVPLSKGTENNLGACKTSNIPQIIILSR